jgi:hypothetical protein
MTPDQYLLTTQKMLALFSWIQGLGRFEEMAKREGRTLSQVCESFVVGALETYKRGGSNICRAYYRVRRGSPRTSFDLDPRDY